MLSLLLSRTNKNILHKQFYKSLPLFIYFLSIFLIFNLKIMTKRELTQLSFKVTGYAIKIHKALGPGLLEKVYEKCLIHELIKNGHYVEQQPAVPVYYDDILINTIKKYSLMNKWYILILLSP